MQFREQKLKHDSKSEKIQLRRWNKKLKQLPSEQSKRKKKGRQKRNDKDFTRKSTLKS